MKIKHITTLISLLLLAKAGIAQGDLDSITVSKISSHFSSARIQNDRLIPPQLQGYRVSLIGSDNKTVIGLDGSITKPLVDKKVNLLFKIEEQSSKKTAEIPVKNVLVKGMYTGSGAGVQPFVIPSLREWYGMDGFYQMSRTSRIVTEKNNSDARRAALLLNEDLKKMLGFELPISTGTATTGDIFIGSNAEKALGREGYSLKINTIFHINAPHYQGKVFGTRTLLQLLAQHKEKLTVPRGLSRDYPTYEVRGLVLDVGRKFFSIDFLNDYVEMMSYYKLSNFHIHLNDNGFAKYFNNNWDSTYAGFRLENEKYPGLASKDGHYSKAEFIALQQKALRYGVTIIPEIDVPAHALAITHVVPETGSKKYGMDHLDLDNPRSFEVVKDIFDEYTKGPNPVFIGEEVHVGTDEYDKRESEKFRKFTDFVIRAVQANGKKVRAWGALTHAQGQTPVTVKDVRLNMWYNGYADPIAMKKLGYQQISTPDGYLYIVPAAGYYYDYLNVDYLYNQWEPRQIGDVTFEKGDPIVDGGMFAVWNDIVGNGISEKDVHNRVFPALQVLSQKMWGADDKAFTLYDFNQKKKSLPEAAGLNIRGLYPSSQSGPLFHFNFENQSNNQSDSGMPHATTEHTSYQAGIQGLGLKFQDNTSSLILPIPEIGGAYTVSFWIKPDKALQGDLFSSKNAVLFADASGLGYRRDGYVYHFGYQLPIQQWTYLSISADKETTQLFVNGKLIIDMKPFDVIMPNKEKDGKEIKFKKVQTLTFPLNRIQLAGAVLDELKIYNNRLSGQEIQSDFLSYQE
ncbi:family 20 glycosylhydrolase [Sphingobacterium detergens]|uniref:family 20 glycosylhydrolase n=1 Tax=Sphingobacterium detergens TaxID=1145106 RepID=UPI003AAE5F49